MSGSHGPQRPGKESRGDAGRAGRSATRTLKAAPLAPAEFALLGLLAQSRDAHGNLEAIHGYDLTRRFTEGALAEVIRLEPGMLYHYLKKLGRAGFISTTVERQQSRPDRQMHALTQVGDIALRAWLTAPVHATRELRLAFLLKLFLARRIDHPLAIRLVDDQRQVTAALVESLTAQLATLPDITDDDRFRRDVLELRCCQTQAALDWLGNLKS
jgi:DNA-binding PadR family transcriptional regulator